MTKATYWKDDTSRFNSVMEVYERDKAQFCEGLTLPDREERGYMYTTRIVYVVHLHDITPNFLANWMAKKSLRSLLIVARGRMPMEFYRTDIYSMCGGKHWNVRVADPHVVYNEHRVEVYEVDDCLLDEYNEPPNYDDVFEQNCAGLITIILTGTDMPPDINRRLARVLYDMVKDADEKCSDISTKHLSYHHHHNQWSDTRSASHAWVMHHMHSARHYEYANGEDERYMCNWCGSESSCEGSCEDCGEGYYEYAEDDRCIDDEDIENYDMLEWADEWVDVNEMSRMGCSTGKLGGFDRAPITCTGWSEAYSNYNFGELTDLQGVVTRLLAHGLTSRPVVITSNLGTPNYQGTAGAMAVLLAHQEELQQEGIYVVCPEQFGSNPNEHYHYIGGMIVIATHSRHVDESLLLDDSDVPSNPKYKEAA